MSEKSGASKIYVTEAGEETQLTSGPGSDRRPAWSPDGARIAFDSNRDGDTNIFVVDADGGNLRRLTSHVAFDMNSSWSPDGTRLAFVSNRSGAWHMWAMDSDGSNQTDLTADLPEGMNVTYRPGWSPDGGRIAFAARGLWVVNSDGSELSQLTRPVDYARDPVWSPNGAMIAVNAWTDQTRGWNSSVYLVSPNGFVIRRVTAPREMTEEVRDGPLGWSADGQEVIFQRSHTGKDKKQELFAVNIRSGDETYLGPLLQSSELSLWWVR